MQVVICGGGAVGACTAYFLSRRGVRPIMVERTRLASAASGKSGGFLALDWCDGTALEQLARRSFHLHARLAGELAGEWGYRPLTTYSGRARVARTGQRHRRADRAWLSDEVRVERCLGTNRTTAQVHPEKFTTAVMHAALANGAELHIGQATDLVLNTDRTKIKGVALKDKVIPCEAVVIAMGPWSRLASQWLPLPAVYGLKGHSLLYETGSRIPGEALFLEYEDDSGRTCSPEMFPRADGTTYVCAISSNSPMPLGSGGCSPGRRSDRAPGGGVCASLSSACRQSHPGPAGLLPSCYSGWSAVDRCGAGCGGRLRGDGPQRVRHPQCTCDR